jgi:hypothetical protein
MVGVGTREPARSALTEIGSVTNPKGETMIQLVKYDCGCIGTPPYTDETHEEKSHIIIDCTGHMDEPGLTERDMTGKTYALLPVDDYYKKIIENRKKAAIKFSNIGFIINLVCYFIYNMNFIVCFQRLKPGCRQITMRP